LVILIKECRVLMHVPEELEELDHILMEAYLELINNLLVLLEDQLHRAGGSLVEV
jgi:hypothetical protein